jgi:5'-3' exonuclease/DNA polymerase III epsilon subunit-like protein
MSERDLRARGQQLSQRLLPHGIERDRNTTAPECFDVRLVDGEVEQQSVSVALGMGGVGAQTIEHLAEAVVRFDEHEQARGRQGFDLEELRRGDRGPHLFAFGLAQGRILDDRQTRRSLRGELGGRLGGSDRMHMRKALCVQLLRGRRILPEDEPGMDESRSEEIVGEVDRIGIKGLGRLIRADERDLSVRVSQCRRERVDTAVNISTKVHSHSRQATPLPLCQPRRVSSSIVKPLVLLDTPALYYRAFYSVPDSIVNDDGQPVNAVRGVLDAVAQMIRRFSSDRVVATMDADWRPEFRTAIMPEYKAARVKDEEAGTEIPPELAGQLPILNRALTAAGIPIAEVAGTEADDVIATMAAESRTPVVIVSPDRDLLALLDSHTDVSVLRPRKGGEWEALTQADLPEAYGVPDGSRYRELAALRGDPSDGLPGAPGIGEKTAATLLENFGSLDSIVKAAKAGVKTGGLSPKRAATIIEVEDTLYKTLEVMRCLTDVDHGIDLESVPNAFDPAALSAAAEGQNIRRSVDNLASALEAATEARSTGGPQTTARPNDLGATAASTSASDPVAAQSASAQTSEQSGSGGSASWTASRLVGFDLETTGVEPATARIVTAAFVDSADDVRTWLADPGIEIPESARAVHGITTEFAQANGAPAAQVVAELCEVFAALRDEGAVVVGHNVVYDLSVMAAEVARHRPDIDFAAIIPTIIDTFVVDKHIDPYRKGKRTLVETAKTYRVELLDAHDASADALAALDISRALSEKSTEIAALSNAEIMAAQGDWKRSQAAGLQAWLRKKGNADAVVDGSWPMA